MYYCVLFLCIFVIVPSEADIKSSVSDADYNEMPLLFHVDDYDRCMALKQKALYCSVTIQLSPFHTNHSKVWKTIEKVISNEKYYRHDRLRHMICVRQFCPSTSKKISILKHDETSLKDEISECYSDKYAHLDLNGSVTQIRCETDQPRYSLDLLDICIAALYGVILLFLIIGTVYEGTARLKTKEEYEALTTSTCGSIISCFSLIKNWKRLAGKSTNVDVRPLKCMNGLRTCNIMAVILSHTFILSLAVPSVNPTFLETASEKPVYMLVMNGTVVIQTYFVMAGWLLSYNFFKIFEKEKRLKISYIILAFVQRYIRLTPCLALVIAFNATWLYHLGSGPFWDKIVGDEYRNCRNNWWVNLLYINNYYDFQNTCMLHTWYLGADTQLFILALLVMALIWKCKKYLKVIFGTCLIVSFIVPGVVNYIYDYDIIVRYYPEPLYRIVLHVNEFRLMYITAHTNIGGYVIGMIFGYIYYAYKDINVFNKRFYQLLWWLFIWGVPLTVIFIAHSFYQETYVPSRIGAAIYTTVGRNFFALAIALATFGVTQKIGWFLRSCIVWSPFQIMGRITYCVYLVHLSLIRIRIGQGRTPVYSSVYTLLTSTLTDIFMSFIFGLFLCLFVELPTSALQKLMLPEMKNKVDRNAQKQKNISIAIISNNDHQISKM
ncbi:hypothetical protein PPYR_01287 [Photinus pyralis]|uniref:Acyltransferase 3 domain-containing protein n=1 Tax=Photinus pyralis TaxID=7054 RepID=A0A5N4B3X5_PHOPY|nr:nose resistant to fluoxetine protein 6-like isoform X2 [Photinus pyralis]XP_031336534.1 nose resistant to fluoxetine protein 6-like isoform X1 [Photinus pyralis]KAB0804317.1 hypothetical protein PPYR_01287 [Photinus pyralis]